MALGQVLAAGNKRRRDGELVRVEVHRGEPLPNHDRVGHTATRLHAKAWEAEAPGIVVPQLRPLKYDPERGAFVEKGVDVALAAHAMEWAVLGGADVVILFSHDSDLLPVVEAVCRIKDSTNIETASWVSEDYRKRIPQRPNVVNHSLRRELFDRIETPINYGAQARARLAGR